MRCVPGMAVGAGGASTVGLKLFAPPGVRLFSVGDTDVVVVVVVVVVLEGAGDSLLLHAVSEPMAMIAPPPATSARRRNPTI